MGVWVDENGTMWNVVNGTEPKSRPQIIEPVWRDIAVLYARAWTAVEEANTSYARPERMRVVEFNNSIVDGNTSTFVVENDDVRALYNESIPRAEYTSRWFWTARQATTSEYLEAEDIARNTTNVTVGPDTESAGSLTDPSTSGTGVSSPGGTVSDGPRFRAKSAG